MNYCQRAIRAKTQGWRGGSRIEPPKTRQQAVGVAVGEEEPKEELRKRLSAFDTYFKQNDKYLGGEPILLLRQRKEKARKSKSFFQVEHLKVLFFIQTKLLLPNFEARTISDKKNHTTPRLSPITYSLSP